MLFYRSVKTMPRTMLTLSCLLLLLLFFYACRSLNLSEPVDYQEEKIMRKNLIQSKLVKNVEEPYVLFKLQHLNQIRRVKLF